MNSGGDQPTLSLRYRYRLHRSWVQTTSFGVTQTGTASMPVTTLMPLRVRSALRSASRRMRPTSASAVSSGFSRLGTTRLLEALIFELPGQSAEAPVQAHHLVTQAREVAAGRQVDEGPELAAAPFDSPPGLVLRP